MVPEIHLCDSWCLTAGLGLCECWGLIPAHPSSPHHALLCPWRMDLTFSMPVQVYDDGSGG